MSEPILPNDQYCHPQCLLVGNGINRLFGDDSWEAIIKNELKVSGSNLSYSDICDMPATMQIVVATGDKVDNRMKCLSDAMLNINISDERASFLKRILCLPVDDILTANYSFELEAADGMFMSKSSYSHRLKNTFDLQERHRQFRLFSYYETQTGNRIRHIHGDLAKPDTMLMGHYYYAKHLKAVQDAAAKAIRNYRIAEKKNEPFKSYSWVDQFLTGDIYVLGFGMYLCESDLWYLVCCKKRNFPKTTIRFYEFEVSDKHKEYMMQAYGVQIITARKLKAKNYAAFYEKAMDDIRDQIGYRSKSNHQ